MYANSGQNKLNANNKEEKQKQLFNDVFQNRFSKISQISQESTCAGVSF